MRRDLFEAGLNEAAGSLAASYGRWSFARSVERIRYSWRGGRGRQRRKGSNAIVAKPGRSLLGSWADMVRCRSGRRKFAGARRWIVRVSYWLGAETWLALWRHELSHRGAERGGEGCCHESALTMRPPQQGQMSGALLVSSA